MNEWNYTFFPANLLCSGDRGKNSHYNCECFCEAGEGARRKERAVSGWIMEIVGELFEDARTGSPESCLNLYQKTIFGQTFMWPCFILFLIFLLPTLKNFTTQKTHPQWNSSKAFTTPQYPMLLCHPAQLQALQQWNRYAYLLKKNFHSLFSSS